MKTSNYKERIRYAIDNIIAKGSFSIIIALTFVVILIIIILSLFIWSLGSNPNLGLIDQFWVYFNTGFGKSAATGTWTYRLTTFLVGIIAIFFSSIIIGSVASAISSKVSELREGKSKVIESNHTVILGWSESLYIIINELIEANRSKGSGCIVVLGNRSNLEMQESTFNKVNLDKSTRVIFRSGSSSSIEDLRKLSIGLAKSIIINIDDDIEAVKTILAIFKDKLVKEYNIPIACKNNDSKNMPVAMIAGEGLVKFLPVYNFIGRIDAQACLHSGIAEVLLDLLDFEGSEIYFHYEEHLIGKTFKDAVLAYDTSSVVGIIKNEKIMINPDAKTSISNEDRLIVISLDDDLIKISNNNDETSLPSNHVIKKNIVINEESKNLYLLGWNDSAPIILDDLMGYLSEGSNISIANGSKTAEKYISNLSYTKNISIEYTRGDIRDKSFLESTNIADATNVLLLRSSLYEDHEMADAATLFTLINLREIRKHSNSEFTILSEVLNSKNAELISVEKSDDFVMSEKIISLMLAQLSENPDLNEFFNELMQPEGSEIYFRKISDYIEISEEVTYRHILEAALIRSETAFGFRINKEAKDKSKNFGIYINPDKLVEREFNESDELIVFSLD
jgi:voltage-gated potassium channel Kch